MTPATESYNHFPSNFLLSGISAVYAFMVAGLDPIITGVILPVSLFAIGKTADILLKVWLQKRKEKMLAKDEKQI